MGVGKIGASKKYPSSADKKIPFFEFFISRYSESARSVNRNRLIFLDEWIEKKYAIDLSEIETKSILEFFNEEIESRDIKKVSKLKWYHSFNSYFSLVEKMKKIEKEEFINPMPPKELITFKDKAITFEEIQKGLEVLDYKTAVAILKIFGETYLMMYIIVSLFLYTGGRMSEIIKINLRNLDINEGFFLVKIKSNLSENLWGIYFIPDFFKEDLRLWIEHKKIISRNSKYLFPGINNKRKHISASLVKYQLRRVKKILQIEKRCNPHAFRDLINESWYDNGLTDRILRKILLNQGLVDVNLKNYFKNHKRKENMRKVYDKYFPFQKLTLKMIKDRVI